MSTKRQLWWDDFPWWFVAACIAALVLLAMFGCAHAPMVCRFAKMDEMPAIVCEDAQSVRYKELRPYGPVPAPVPPKGGSVGPYWRYDGREKDKGGT